MELDVDLYNWYQGCRRLVKSLAIRPATPERQKLGDRSHFT